MNTNHELLVEASTRSARAAAASVLGPNHHALDEIVAGAIKKTLSKSGQGAKVSPGYAARIARNNALKTKRHEARFIDIDADQSTSFIESADTFNNRELLEGAVSLARELFTTIEELGPRDRKFFKGLVIDHQFDVEEFAQESNTSSSAVKTKFSRLTTRLYVKVQRRAAGSRERCLLRTLRCRGVKRWEIVRGLLKILLNGQDLL